MLLSFWAHLLTPSLNFAVSATLPARPAGISGVKVDCQAGVGLVGSRVGGGPSTALRVHTALENSIAANFAGNHAINCMCHSTENIYRWRDTAVARASGGWVGGRVHLGGAAGLSSCLASTSCQI
jgi:hypothetical protein